MTTNAEAAALAAARMLLRMTDPAQDTTYLRNLRSAIADVTGWPVGRCKFCPAPVIWARTNAGKATPLDVDPNPAGQWTLHADPDGKPHVTKAPADETGHPIDRYVTHWATCPGAAEARRRTAPRGTEP